MSNRDEQVTGNEIAVVGMAGRFPGADSIAEYWANLRDGVESIHSLSDEDLARAGVPVSVQENANYVKRAAVLNGVEMFDASLFGFNPKDAAIMDPQHRHFLECCWAAMESAGYPPASTEAAVGVFAGSGMHGYMMFNLLRNRELLNSVGLFLIRHTGNDKDFLTTRVSYALNLRGPSVNVQTACSTSLVAIHMACQSLLNGECDMALAGGVTIEHPHGRGYLYREGEILSPDGRCRAFDASAQGTVFGSGVGVVVLRRLDAALAGGDFVHAVIRGSAINNDGSLKVGYLAPSVDGQAAAVEEAIGVAGVPAETISYVETHGTGTPVGDPIEISALSSAFGGYTGRKGFCGIGSVKTNVGHLDTAAGVAGFIKVVEALKHRQIPPSLHFERPNPAIDFESSPFYVNHQLREWTTDGAPRRAGVNSLGVGGTNAHVILEEAPPRQPGSESRPWQLLLLSAKSKPALDSATDNLIAHLRSERAQPLADVAYTLQVGREPLPQRLAVVCRDHDGAIAGLEDERPDQMMSGAVATRTPSVAFMFAGGGAQYPGMGANLYRDERVFQEAVEQCMALLAPEVAVDVRSVLFVAAEQRDAATRQIERPSIALPALFITQYAQARLWMSWGIRPSAMIGHSMGEYTAACLAGVIDLKDALSLVSLRGRLFEQVAEGGMLSVPLPPEDLAPMLDGQISIAATNAPSLCVASGPLDALADLERRLAEREIESRRIRIAVAAHSSMLDPILPAFRDFLHRVRLRPPSVPVISNVTGTWMTDAEATDPEYWVRHLRGTVRFSEGVDLLLEEPDRILLEVGPGRTLVTLARQHPRCSSQPGAFNSLRHPDEDVQDTAFMLSVLARLWISGVRVDWAGFYADEVRRRVPLPTYPFEHRPYWIEADPASRTATEEADAGVRRELPHWFYRPVWRRAELPTNPGEAAAGLGGGCALVMVDPAGLGEHLADAVCRAGGTAVRVYPGHAFSAADDGMSYTVSPGSADDWRQLIGALARAGLMPRCLVHCWGISAPEADAGDAARSLCFDSLLLLAKAMGEEGGANPMRLLVLSEGMQQVAGEEVPFPSKALLMGPCKVIPREFPWICCRSVDLQRPPSGSWQERRLVERVLTELANDGPDEVIAYRGLERFRQDFEPFTLERPSTQSLRVRARGTYLITGGLGGIGLTLAEELAREAQVNLVLVGRTPMPDRGEWPRWLSSHGEENPTSRRIRAIQRMEASGARVRIAAADVRRADEMRRVITEARQQLGEIRGVIHAAGVIDDQLIQLKSIDSAQRVLAAKVAGTLVLDQLLPEPLDFFLLCSSVSSLAGLAGQVDYAAANAFLDAFAHHRTARVGDFTVAINWSAWQEVGMAADLAGNEAKPPTLRHPLLQSWTITPEGNEVFSTSLSVSSHWILREHRLRGGNALIPGTGYLELVRAALAARPEPRAVEFKDVLFLSPFLVPDGVERVIQVWLNRGAGASEFVVASPSEGDGGWNEHARGHVGYAAEPLDRRDLRAIAARCSNGNRVPAEGERNAHIEFGPRWQNVKQIRFGRGEALVRLELPSEFQEDLQEFALHPALLDFATAGAQSLIPGVDPARDFYVPVGYAHLRFRGSMPAQVSSHIRLSDASEDAGIASFDVTVLDDAGEVIVEITEFMMKRVNDQQVLDMPRPVERPHLSADPRARSRGRASGSAAVDLTDAIRPGEGAEVFWHVMNAPVGAQIIASPRHLPTWLAEIRSAAEAAVPGDIPLAVQLDPQIEAELLHAEEVLLQHEAIQAAAVVARLDQTGEIRRVAFVVHDPLHHATVSELRRFLKARIPEALVPSSFVQLDTLPIGNTGVVDRAALPDPFGREDHYVAPSTPTQQAIAGIWKEVLGASRVGVHDNFFDIGGHSLLAVRTISKIDKKLGVKLDNATLVLHTLEQIAAKCERRATEEPASKPERLTKRIFNALRPGALNN